MKKSLTLFALVGLLLSCMAQISCADDCTPKLWIIGDSTVRNGHNGMVGWGEMIGPYFDGTKIQLENKAIGGRSSRTFRHEGRWDEVLKGMKRGDFLLVQFGHNDGGPIGEQNKYRGSLKGMGDESEVVVRADGSEEVVHTFSWYMRQYASEARAKGATVVLLSPVPHKAWDGQKLKTDFVETRKWGEDAAKRTRVDFVDLTQIITDAYNKQGPEVVEAYFADARTHTSREGAAFNARGVIAGLKGLPGAPFRKYFSDEAAAIQGIR